MPLWLVIMVLGASGCGWLFLKARQTEAVMVKKKVAQGSKDVKEAAKKAAKRGAGIVEPEILEAEQPVGMSMDISSTVAKQLEEIMKEKNV